MFRKNKTLDQDFDFLPSEEKEEQKQTYRYSRQSVQKNSFDIGDRQSRLSDAFRDLEEHLSEATFDVAEVLKDEISTLTLQKQMLQKQVQDFRQKNIRLNLTALQLAENDKNKSQTIEKLREQIANLSEQLKQSQQISKQAKPQPLQNIKSQFDAKVQRLQREILSYKVRIGQFENDLKIQVERQISLQYLSEQRKSQIEKLKTTVRELKDRVGELKNETHDLNLIIANKKTIILAIQNQLKPHKSVKEEQLAEQVKQLIQCWKRLTQEASKNTKAMEMIETIIKENRIKPEYII